MNRSISVPDDLDARVESARGDVPRSVFWVRAMERALGDATGDRIPERPAPPRSSSPDPEACQECGAKPDGRGGRQHRPGCGFVAPARAPKAQRRQKATDAMSAALARQQALNKPKGI